MEPGPVRENVRLHRYNGTPHRRMTQEKNLFFELFEEMRESPAPVLEHAGTTRNFADAYAKIPGNLPLGFPGVQRLNELPPLRQTLQFLRREDIS